MFNQGKLRTYSVFREIGAQARYRISPKALRVAGQLYQEPPGSKASEMDKAERERGGKRDLCVLNVLFVSLPFVFTAAKKHRLLCT